MNTVKSFLAGAGILIAIYLFLANATQTSRLITSISTAVSNGIKVLQGR